ncbi:hypothetical protein HAX54_038335 [Datura stramonium]|uniref:Uncharacterized protein n=1 Tax=Datura stramonium TaxID=4076 RepID=A0ABS8SHU6_DATST|nr:hypothetical protein [Datura stramonium]
MVEPSSSPAGDKEIRETFNRIDEGIKRIKVGLEGMMVLLEKMAKREELKTVAAAESQSTFDHKEELECLKGNGIEGQTVVADSPIELVNFGFSNLSHVHSKETSMKKTSYTCKVLDEMPKRDLDVDSLYSGSIERNNKIKAFEDLFLDLFFIDNKRNVEAFEDMYLGWLFFDEESDMDPKSLNSDWKEVLSWQAHYDLIISKNVFHSSSPLFRDTSTTVEGTACSGQNGRLFAVISSSGQTHEYCEKGFNLSGAGKKMPERITAKDIQNNIVESIVDGLSKQKSADHATWEFFNTLTTRFCYFDP